MKREKEIKGKYKRKKSERNPTGPSRAFRPMILPTLRSPHFSPAPTRRAPGPAALPYVACADDLSGGAYWQVHALTCGCFTDPPSRLTSTATPSSQRFLLLHASPETVELNDLRVHGGVGRL